MSVNTREISSKRAYESYSASAAETKLSGDWRNSDSPSLIGDANALLLTYMLQSNGESVDLRNLRSALGSSADNIGTIVTSTNGEQALPLNSTVSMELTNVIVSYFRSGAMASLRNLPEDADSDYIRYRRMITGSVIDASGELEVNKVLDAAAVYGENHWYWEKDEAAFLGGAECQNRFSKSTEKIQTRLEFPGTYYYRTNYTQHIAYNCLVSIPLGKSFASGQYSPLREYERMCEEFGKTEQKPARDPEPEINGSFAAPGKTENGFSDAAPNAYYRDAVDWAVENAITEGTDAAHFSPDAVCTRAQTVTFLWRAAGCPEAAAADTFRDVVRGSYYEKAVSWAVAEGITRGTSASAFSPDAVCTRAQMITFLYRFAGAVPVSSVISLADVAAGVYYYDAVAWAYANNVAGGTSSTTFSPDAVCTRAQTVTFLHRLLCV